MSSFDWPIAVAALLLSEAVVVAVLWWRTRRLERLLRALAERREEKLVDVPTSMMVTGLSRLEQRLGRLEGSLRTSPATPPASGGADRSYDLAQRMARQGASVEQIIEACGIGRQEAELLMRLHAPR